MKKIFILMIIISANANAGFWSSVAGGVVANSITGSGGSSKNRMDRGQSESMKIQQALYGLGIYDVKLDGNLNTLESRTAINSLQKKFGIDETGILSVSTKQNLLFIHELYSSIIKKTKQKSGKEEIYMLYDEVDKAKNLIKKKSFIDDVKSFVEGGM